VSWRTNLLSTNLFRVFAADSRWMGRTSTTAVARCGLTFPSCRSSTSSLTTRRVGTTPIPIYRVATPSTASTPPRHHWIILEMAFLDHLVAQVCKDCVYYVLSIGPLLTNRDDCIIVLSTDCHTMQMRIEKWLIDNIHCHDYCK